MDAHAGRHAVVVGGSGMLAGLCRSLARDGWLVTVVGRERAKLDRVASGDPRIHPIAVDYEQIDAFEGALREASADRGPIELAVCWIRSWAPRSLLAAAAAVAPNGTLVHVLGSQTSKDSAPAIRELEERDGLSYHQVELGVVREGGRQRWLTNDEISDGVHAAILGLARGKFAGSKKATKAVLKVTNPRSSS